MHHTLNKRDTYAKAIHEQKQLEEELSWGHTGTQEKLPTPTDERRRPTVAQARARAELGMTQDMERMWGDAHLQHELLALINDEDAWKEKEPHQTKSTK